MIQHRLVQIMSVPESFGFLRGQLDFMHQRGFEIHAVASPGERLDMLGRKERVYVHGIELRRKIDLGTDAKSVVTLTRLLRDLQPDIVHSHTPKGGLLGTVAATCARVPIRIYHIRGLPYLAATGKKKFVLKASEWISCRLAHQVYCVSYSIRDAAIADGVCPVDKILVFGGGSGNGVDAVHRFDPARFPHEERDARRAKLGLRADEPVLGFVGRVVKDKGIEELFEAWTSLRREYPLLRLVLVGPVEPQDPVSATTLEALHSDQRVIMVGSVDDTSEYYPFFDLVVLPTYREGLPNVPLEAAAMELPVVATRIPGCVDAIEDGVTGTLVPVRDAEALADAIRLYLDDPEVRSLHGRAGRERVLRDFRQEVIWEAVYQEYCRLLTEKGLPVPQPRDPTVA